MSEEMLRSYEELRAEFSTACAELEKERERREKAESGYCEHRCQTLGIAECMNPEWENDRAERDRLREALVFARDFIMSGPRPGDEMMAVQRISAALEPAGGE